MFHTAMRTFWVVTGMLITVILVDAQTMRRPGSNYNNNNNNNNRNTGSSRPRSSSRPRPTSTAKKPADGKTKEATGSSGSSLYAKKKEEVVEEKPATNFDAVQESALMLVDKMVNKLYGLEELPAGPKAEVQDTIFRAVDGTHNPKRDKVADLSTIIITNLQKEQMSPDFAYTAVYELAQILSEDTLSRDDLESLIVFLQREVEQSSLPEAEGRSFLKNVELVVMSAERNDKKIEDREKARKAEEERKKKEAEKKAEEARLLAEKKAQAETRRSSRSAGGGGDGGGAPAP